MFCHWWKKKREAGFLKRRKWWKINLFNWGKEKAEDKKRSQIPPPFQRIPGPGVCTKAPWSLPMKTTPPTLHRPESPCGLNSQKKKNLEDCTVRNQMSCLGWQWLAPAVSSSCTIILHQFIIHFIILFLHSSLILH